MDFELLALALRPWRMLRSGALLTPVLAVLVLLPWLWAMPRMHSMPIPLQWSGAPAGTQSFALMMYSPFFTLMEAVGHSGSQSPHEVHKSVLIFIAMMVLLIVYSAASKRLARKEIGNLAGLD